jgi:hypothetical protein
VRQLDHVTRHDLLLSEVSTTIRAEALHRQPSWRE